MSSQAGPLSGVRVVEVGSIGPGPFAAMVLADLGADVVRLERPGGAAAMTGAGKWNVMHRGRRSVGIDLKKPEAAELVLELCETADVLIEGFRPGVMERLGMGPDDALARNPKLVYGRITGYGQDGPMAQVAGHDINYIALAGVLGAVARQGERPLFPMNLVGDFGGGGMLLVVGVLAALLEARVSGQGQVVDAAMVEGSALLSTLIHAFRGNGMWKDEAGTNLLDSGAHFYEVYRAGDGGHVAVGAIEPQFYARLLELLEIPMDDMPQWDVARWPEFKERLAALFATRPVAEWAALLEPEETCTTAVYGLADAPAHPHNVARGTFVEHNGVVQPAPAPRFSRTPAAIARPAAEPGEHTDEALADWGFSAERIAALREAGAVS